MRKTKLWSNFCWQIYGLVYDQIMLHPPYQKLLAQVKALLCPQEGEVILDAGCGTGNFVLQCFRKKGAGTYSIEGWDCSPSMLARARRKCRFIPQAKFIHVDLNKPPRVSNSFDAIVSINVLYILDDPAKTLRYFASILKSKGRIVLATPCESANLVSQLKALFKPAKQGMNFRKKLKYLVKISPIFFLFPVSAITIVINKMILRSGKKGKYHFISEEKLKKILEQAGFSEIKIVRAYEGNDYLVKAVKAG